MTRTPKPPRIALAPADDSRHLTLRARAPAGLGPAVSSLHAGLAVLAFHLRAA